MKAAGWAFLPIIAVSTARALAASDASANRDTDVFVTPLFGFTVSGDSHPAPGQPLEQWLGRFNYGLTQHVGPKFKFSYLHLNFDSTLGRVTSSNGAYLYPGNGFQAQDTIAFGYAASHVTTLSAGWFSKTQSCCPASSQSHLADRGVRLAQSAARAGRGERRQHLSRKRRRHVYAALGSRPHVRSLRYVSLRQRLLRQLVGGYAEQRHFGGLG
jgi:hypothetical protein